MPAEPLFTLYHGTTPENAARLLKEGKKGVAPTGSNSGQKHLLYVTTHPDNAMWYANQSGSATVLKVHVPKSQLTIDPEDGIHDTVDAELEASAKSGIPASLAVHGELPPSAFIHHAGIIKEAMPTSQEIREKYLANQIFLLGEKIGPLEVIDRRSNYIVVVDSEGKDRKMFLDEAYGLMEAANQYDREKVWGTATPKELGQEASAYQNDNWSPGTPGYARAKDLDWTYEHYPLHKIHNPGGGDWKEWFKGEQDGAKQDGREGYYDTMLDRDISYPVVIHHNGEHGYIWDGYHRVGAQHVKGETTVPAIVGRKKIVAENEQKGVSFSRFSEVLKEGVFSYKGFRSRNISENVECEKIFLALAEECQDPWALLSAVRAVDAFFEHRNTSTLERARSAVARVDDISAHTYLSEAKLKSHDMPYRTEQHPEKEGVNPPDVIRSLHKNYKCSPSEINNGQCDEFANDIIKRIGGSVWTSGVQAETGEYNHLPTHDFVEHKGKFYDAEAPEGVDHWHQLPIFQKAMTEHTGLKAAIKAAEKLGPAWKKLSENKSIFTMKPSLDLLDEDIDFAIDEKLTYSGFKTVLTEEFEREASRALSKLEKEPKLLDELSRSIKSIADIAHHYDQHSVHMKESAEDKVIAHAEKTKRITLRKTSSGPQVVKLAKRAAVELIAQKLANKPIKKISKKEKTTIIDLILKKKDVVMRLAKKLVPRIKAIEHDSHEHPHEQGDEEFGSAGS